MGREAYGTRHRIKEIASNSATVIIATLNTIVEFGCSKVTVVIGRMVFVTEEALLPMHVWIEITMMLCIAMTETGG